MSGRLEGKVAAITGSSRGIGLAVARAFLVEGAKVVINSREGAVADRVARELGGESVGVGAKLDVFVNNAGTVHAGPTLDLSLVDWERVIKLNMTAVFLCSRAAARAMLGAGGGVILNTASVQAFAPFPRRLAYGSSKAAVVMMTRIMAAEWAPAIRVNAVAPGYVRTEMTARLEAEGRIDFKAIAGRTPQGKMADPVEIAGAYVYLASQDASFVTGETLVVDGGWLAFGAFPGV